MIKCLQGSNIAGLPALSMSYRGKLIGVDALEYRSPPYIGCELTKNGAIELRDWLNDVINISQMCDDCYRNRHILDMYLGKFKCKICGHETVCK